MRLAILTDIHANREAFSAVLDDLAERGIDRIVLLGDLVGYGPDPEWCTDRAMTLVASGALAVKGNHDHAIGDPTESMGSTARRAIEWTRPRLSEAQKAFLAALPLTATADDLLFVHASADSPADWVYVTSDLAALGSFGATKARVIFCGHVHVPMLVSCDLRGTVRAQEIKPGLALPLIRSRRWLAVVGSVGQPRDGTPAAGYAILDTATNELTFRRTPYDSGTTVAKLRAAGLPEPLATRLMTGV